MSSRASKILQTAIGEMFASFFFGFAVYSAILGSSQSDQSSAPVIVSLSLALSGVAVIYAFCDVTVAHFNPAITLAAILTLKIPIILGIIYLISQFAGFILAGLVLVACFPGKYKDKLEIVRPKIVTDDVSKGTLFAAEFFLTAILVYVAFSVGVNPYEPPKDQEGVPLDPDEEIASGRKITAPIAIGFTLGFCGLLALSSSGGAFNPGIVLAPMILTGTWSNWWVYLLGEFSGGLCGALLQSFVLYKLF
ncbi:aquaporin-like [Pieris brassicae]|uniref:aquaporin-like n=1 Tax=Pieris brassicae TaxID=7116 RepID=UPI001E661D5B|nr:aquaporin-like [Pieris brassicae]